MQYTSPERLKGPDLDAMIVKMAKVVNESDISNPEEKEKCHQGLIWFRKLACIGKKPRIDKVIEANILGKVVSLLHLEEGGEGEGEETNESLTLESTWIITNMASGTSEQTRLVVDAGCIPLLVQLLKNPSVEVRDQAIWALGNLAGDNLEFRDMCLQAGALDWILEVLASNSAIETVRNAVWTISNLSKGKPKPFGIEKCLPLIAAVVQESHDDDTVANCLWTLSSLSDGGDEEIGAVIATGIVPRLVTLLQSNRHEILSPVLRIFGNFVSGNEEFTQAAIAGGFLDNFEHIIRLNKGDLIKELCFAISNIAAGNQEQIQSLIDTGIIQKLFDLYSITNEQIHKEIDWCVINICTGGSKYQIDHLLELGALPILYRLLVNDDEFIVSSCIAAIEHVIELDSDTVHDLSENSYAIEFDKLGGTIIMRKLAESEDPEVQYKAADVLNRFFNTESTDEVEEFEDIELYLSEQVYNERIYIRNKEVTVKNIQVICNHIEAQGDKIKKILLRNNQLNEHALKVLLEWIGNKGVHIQDICVENNNIKDSHIRLFGEMLLKNKNIQSLSFGNYTGGNNISDNGIKHLLHYTQKCHNLRKISFNMNDRLSRKAMPMLVEMIKRSRIEYLDIQNTSLSPDNQLIIQLASNQILNGCKVLNLSSRELKDNDMAPIFEAVKKESRYIEQVLLNHNQLTSKGVVGLFESLRSTMSIEKIDLSSNPIDDSCMESLGDLMKFNQTIKVLNLAKCKLSNNGINKLLSSLVGNSALIELDLEGTQISGKIKAQLTEVAQHSGIQTIKTGSTKISKDVREELNKVLSIPSDDRDIPIYSKTKSAAKSTATY